MKKVYILHHLKHLNKNILEDMPAKMLSQKIKNLSIDNK